MTDPVQSRPGSAGPEPGAGPPPFFVVGAERSGTTLLRLLLGHHPRIAPVDEFDYVTPFIGDGPGFPPVDDYLRFLAGHRAFRACGRRIDPGASVPELARSFLEQVRARCPDRLLGAVVHRDIHRIARIWPDACYVRLVRDPRDVALSTIGMGWAGNVFCAVQRWIESHDRWRQMRAGLGPERFVELRFEDLVASPESELSRVCRFLGVAFDPAMLAIEEDTTYGRPSPRAAGRWQGRLSPRELGLLEGRVGGRLAEAGYAGSGHPPVFPSPLERARLRAQDRWARATFRRRKYGLRLYVADVLSRRLPFDGWRTRVRDAVHAVEQRHLR